MFDEVISKILDSVAEKQLSENIFPKFSGDGYNAHRIDKNNFHEIKKSDSGGKIAFIDGGNAEIIGSANFSLNLIRVCCAIYQNNKKIEIKKFEVLAFINSFNEGGEIHYKCTFFNLGNGLNMDEIAFNSLDNTLMAGINRAEIGNVSNAIRRFYELMAAKYAADNKLAGIIVLDGNLQCTLTNESKHMKELQNSCEINNVILCALSKTSSLFTDNGDLLSAVLLRLIRTDSWHYHPIADIESGSHKADMHFAKFNGNSRHVFRFEILKSQKENAERAISEISANSCDPIFLGYPYGLVEADRIARVSNQERESLKTMLLVKLRSRNIEKYLNAVNAHEILDKISF